MDGWHLYFVLNLHDFDDGESPHPFFQYQPKRVAVCRLVLGARYVQCLDEAVFKSRFDIVFLHMGGLVAVSAYAVAPFLVFAMLVQQDGNRFLRRVFIPSVIVAGQEEAVTQTCSAQQVADDVGRLARRACEPCPSAVNPQGGDGK